MTTDMQPENGTFPVDQATAPILAATTARRRFLKSRTALAFGVGSLGLIFGLLIDGGESTQTVQAAGSRNHGH
jgi:hypothetical protein